MLNQIIEVIKNTAVSTVGLVVGLLGVDNADFLDSNNANLQTNQEQSINLADFAQANISEALNSETETIIESEPEIEVTEVPISTEITESAEDKKEKEEIEYFEKEDIPVAIFARPESTISYTEPKDIVITSTLTDISTATSTNFSEKEVKELIVLGEEPIEEVRAINPIKTTKAKKEVDVSKILNLNLDKFDTKLQISEITEDEENFYITYQYITLAVEDRAWKEVVKKKNISINKNILGSNDLGVYLSEELAEVIDTEIIYLKEVQEIQKIKNAKETVLAKKESERMVASSYSSLIGKVLDINKNDFGDYEPIVKEEDLEETTAISEISKKEETVVKEEVALVEDKTTSAGVIDNEAPLVVIQGNNPALIQLGSSYVDLGAKVIDNISEGLGIKVGGDVVDTSTKGSYFVTYTATDEAGNVATATREVIVYNYGATPDVEQVVEDTSTIQNTETTVEIAETINQKTSQKKAEQDKKLKKTVIDEEVIDESESASVEVATSTENSEEIIEEIIEEVIVDMSQTQGTDIYDMGLNEEEKLELEAQEEALLLETSAVTEILEGAVETITGTIDETAEVVQETIDAVVETTGAAVDTTIETVSESVENVVEATNEVAEQVTAMILSINIRELLGNISASINVREMLGNVGSSIDLGIGTKIGKALDKAGSIVYNNINEVIFGIINIFDKTTSGITDIFNKILNDVVSVSESGVSSVYEGGKQIIGKVFGTISNSSLFVYENINKSTNNFLNLIDDSFKGVKYLSKNSFGKINQTAQVLGSDIFNLIEESMSSISDGANNTAQIIGGSTFNLFIIAGEKTGNTFDFVKEKTHNISETLKSLLGSMTASISENGSRVGEISSSKFNGALSFIKIYYQRTKEIFSGLTEKISGKLSLAGIKYSKEVNDTVNFENFEKIEVEDEAGDSFNKVEFLKSKFLMIGEYTKEGFTKTLNFFKENKPTF